MSESKSVMANPRTTRPGFVPTPAFYDHVARGYDLIASSYDDVEGRNEISETVRRFSIEAALKVFRPGNRILELGCGTGRDAVALAQRGVRVDATDVSPAMIAATRARVLRENLSDLVSVRCQSAATAASEGGPYDGAFSNGAVLNLEPDLESVARGLYRSMAPGSVAVLTVANRLSLFELLFYSIVLKPRKAFRKLGHEVPIPVSREGEGKSYVVPTRFLTPREFVGAFRPGFERAHQRGIQVITPPWNLVDLARLIHPAILGLERIENRVGTAPGLRSLGSIYLVSLIRK